jgi:hypothetical protein
MLSEQKEYLDETIYPTLLPLLEKLILLVKRQGYAEQEQNFDPLVWLAQQLMRNSHKH